MPSIQQAACSTVILETTGGEGTGVAVLSPHYILTALHVIKDQIKEDAGKKTVQVKVTTKEQAVINVSAEVIEILGTSQDPQPDLAVLYIPELPESVLPLQFAPLIESEPETSPAVWTKWNQHRNTLIDLIVDNPTIMMNLGSDVVTRLNETLPPHGRKYIHEETVYLIGVPYQRSPIDLLVNVGRIDRTQTLLDPSGLVHTTAIALPGNSGGPAIDENGNLIGIVVRLVPKNNFLNLPFNQTEFEFDFKKGTYKTKEEIIGSLIYHVAEWGSAIQKAVEEHQSSLLPK